MRRRLSLVTQPKLSGYTKEQSNDYALIEGALKATGSGEYPTFRTSNWHIGYLNEAIRITAIFSSMVLNS